MSYRTHCAQRRYAHACRTARRMDRFFAACASQAQALTEMRQAIVARADALPAMPITFTRDGRLRVDPRARRAA